MANTPIFDLLNQANFVLNTATVGNGGGADATAYATTAIFPLTDRFACTGFECLVLNNTAAASTTVTMVTPKSNDSGRVETITYSLAASDFKIVGPFKRRNFADGNGDVTFGASAATAKTAIVRPRFGGF